MFKIDCLDDLNKRLDLNVLKGCDFTVAFFCIQLTHLTWSKKGLRQNASKLNWFGQQRVGNICYAVNTYIGL